MNDGSKNEARSSMRKRGVVHILIPNDMNINEAINIMKFALDEQNLIAI
ncbi:MAG: hypothetical protein JXA38_01925 [Methanosarcinaceae archaeon]|nr:hypothetical protein [Methanosarcinaceae archaeon]